ncbi:MAG: FG-GAP-like repeat-containing protein [Acidobacteriota bacterium]
MNQFLLHILSIRSSLSRFLSIQSGKSRLLLIALCLLAIYGWRLIEAKMTASEAPTKREVARARLSEQASIQAAGWGNPWIGLSDGRELMTHYVGPQHLVEAIEKNEARPLSLASADFDEDGVADLVCGYEHQGRGIVVLHRGNADSIYPNSLEAQQRRASGAFTDAPFLSPARVFASSDAADLIGAGDFDADGHWDVVVASRGSDRLNLLSGDGRGVLSEAKQIELPGAVTAMTVGEINRRDGLDDLVVGVAEADGAKAMVFEGPEGALRSRPEIFDLPAEATSLALGQLDDEYAIDLAVAAGNQLMIAHGRDRKLSLDSIRQAEVPLPDISRWALPYAVNSIAVGDFTGDNDHDIAALCEDGSARLLMTNGRRSKALARSAWSDAARLVRIRVSSASADDLAVVDSKSARLDILGGRAESVGTPHTLASVSLDARSEIIDVLPARLNSDALSDLIALTKDSGLIVAMTEPQAVFTVTNTNDIGAGSLRQALLNANSSGGLDTITFNIASGVQTIKPSSELPAITSPVTIDGTTQPGFAGVPLIEIDGSSAGTFADGLKIMSGSSAIRGLVINRFNTNGSSAIHIETQGSNIIEGNFLGVNAGGTQGLGGVGGSNGVTVNASSNNLIGGTTAQARNLISGNGGFGIEMRFNQSGNLVQGNFIGTDVTGRLSVGNAFTGVEILLSANNNTVGGTTAGARNIISGNRSRSGVTLANNARGNLVQGNFIGTNVTGAASVGNSFAGVEIATNTPDNTVGGTTAQARNIISGNGRSSPTGGYGVQMFSQFTTGNLVQGNFIGTDASGSAKLGNSNHGVGLEDGATGNTVGGAVEAARNVISGNKAAGVNIGIFNRLVTTRNTVQGNLIGTDALGAVDLGNDLNGVRVSANADGNMIVGNLIAFNKAAGVAIPNVEDGVNSVGIRISILGNSIVSNVGLGIDLGAAGETPNDPLDVDTGPNELQNFPALTSVTQSLIETAPGIAPAAAITISGTFNSTPNTTCNLQFFFGASCQSEGSQLIGSIPVFLGSTQVVTDGSGNAPFLFSFELPAGATGGWVNCTATNSTGNTSEFSRCIAVGTLPSPKPRITSVTRNGKKLFVDGQMFDSGAKILLNGSQQKTRYESATRLIGKKAGKKIKPGDRVQVRNPDGTLSNEVTYSPP